MRLHGDRLPFIFAEAKEFMVCHSRYIGDQGMARENSLLLQSVKVSEVCLILWRKQNLPFDFIGDSDQCGRKNSDIRMYLFFVSGRTLWAGFQRAALGQRAVQGYYEKGYNLVLQRSVLVGPRQFN